MTADRAILLLNVEIASERDVVQARQRARQLAALLGFGQQDQARIATATSEICRNAARYAGRGRCEFSLLEGERPALLVRTTDEGPGIRNLEEVLGGRFQSATGMGLGIVGTQRLMDQFTIHSAPGKGTTVVFGKRLPLTSSAAVRSPSQLSAELVKARAIEPEEEVRQSDRELLRAIAELRSRSEELEQIRGELEETNRGVVALYAELDQKADSLRKATELKSRFLANMSHEFRTPLNSIQSLARIVLDGSEGPVTEGQRKAVELMRKSAIDLTEMVNDLLDLAKIEAGKISVRPSEFDAAHMLGSLRAVLRPLIADGSPVQLVFDPVPELPLLYSDEGKITQIVRNFASNALKFTERGEVRIGARKEGEDRVSFFVRDTGIGIAEADQKRIFEEFTQVDSARQRKVKGTGLGLPLSKKLAEMLGGSIEVASEPGKGSTFTLTVPARHIERQERRTGAQAVVAAVTDPQVLQQWETFLEGSRYRLSPAATLEEASALVRKERAVAVIVGSFLHGAPTRPLLAELKKDPATREIPVIGFARAEHEARLLALGTDAIAFGLAERHDLLETLARALSPPRRVLLIAQDARDELRAQLSEPRVELLEARDAQEGLRRAREERPRTVVLDATSPGFAEQALELLREDPETRALPVLVRVPRPIPDDEAERLHSAGARLVNVGDLMREDAARMLRAAVWEAGGARA